MKIQIFLFVTLLFLTTSSSAQSDSKSGTFWNPNPRNYEVKQSIEIESLASMFFTGGYHFGIGNRYEKFRFRFSVINGGTYTIPTFELSPVVRIGARLWKKY